MKKFNLYILASFFLICSLQGQVEKQQKLSSEAMNKIKIFLKSDSVILFDNNIPATIDKEFDQTTNKKTQALLEKSPGYSIPFVSDNKISNNHLVVHRLNQKTNKPLPLTLKSYFSDKGIFMGSESIEKINDPRRMEKSIVEKGMKGIKHRIIDTLPDDIKIDYNKLWSLIDKKVNLAEIKEINMYPVLYELEDGSRSVKVIINIWGPDNPLGMPDELPPFLKNRIRLIYDPADQSWFADNFL